MLKTVEGIYQNGQIKLAEIPPEAIDSTQVLITFLSAEKLDPSQIRQLIDRLETILGIQQGLNQVNSGQTRSIHNFLKVMQKKYDISG